MPVIDQAIWGRDLRMLARDIKIDSSGDIEVLQGFDNVLQALRHRLTTERGFLPYDNTYGIDLSLFIGRKNTVEKQEMLKFAIIDCLKYETRIRSIDDIIVILDANNPTVLYATVRVTPITSTENITLNLIYPWYTTGAVAKVEDEESTSTSRTTVTTTYDIYSVDGVYISKGPHYDYNVSTNRIVSGTNYYIPSGSFYGRTITLTKPLPTTFMTVFTSYEKYVSEGTGT